MDQVTEDESDVSDAFDDVDTGILIEDDGSVPQYNDTEDDSSDCESEASSSEFEGDFSNPLNLLYFSYRFMRKPKKITVIAFPWTSIPLQE